MIEVKDICKTYIDGVVTPVLKGISFTVGSGEFVSIMGPSGAGKSTLLYQMSLLDHPSSGSILIDGVDVVTIPSKERTAFRLNNLGYIFQDYAILPDLTAMENVSVPLLMLGFSKKEAYRRAAAVLDRMGLGDRLDNIPGKLSGGEQQRVSIARSIVNNPKILFADEPTASLDTAMSQMIIDTLRELNSHGQTIVMVTHEPEYAQQTDRIVYIQDGVISKDQVLRR